jgi:hypothetical protein
MEPESHNLFVLFMLATMTPDVDEWGILKNMSFDYSSMLTDTYCIL